MNANAYYRNDAFQELKAAVERYRAQDPVGLQANVAAAVAIAAVAIRYVDSVPTKARRPASMSRAGKGYKRHRSDSNQAAIVEVLRKMGKRVWIIGRPSDLLVLDGGRLHLVDTKRQGGTLTQAQQKAVDAGWPIRFVHSETEALALFSVGADRGRAQTEKVD